MRKVSVHVPVKSWLHSHRCILGSDVGKGSHLHIDICVGGVSDIGLIGRDGVIHVEAPILPGLAVVGSRHNF